MGLHAARVVRPLLHWFHHRLATATGTAPPRSHPFHPSSGTDLGTGDCFGSRQFGGSPKTGTGNETEEKSTFGVVPAGATAVNQWLEQPRKHSGLVGEDPVLRC